MQLLNSQQQWDMMQNRQAELLKEAQEAHLARIAQGPQQPWWRSLFRRQSQSPTLTHEASVNLELIEAQAGIEP